MKVLGRFLAVGFIAGLLLGCLVVGVGAMPPEAAPRDMLLGGAFTGTMLSGLLGVLVLSLWGIWWLASGRGRLGLENNTPGARAAVTTVGALSGGVLGGLGVGSSLAYWWYLQVYPSYPEWGPFLAAVESPVAFVLGGGVGGLGGALLGLLAGHGIGRVRPTVR